MAIIDVSIIIPTYNRLAFLKRAIASCCSVNCKIEIIVVDDGSTDGTWDWLQTQPNIRAFRQSNQGQPWALLRGFQHSRGKYVRLLDSDDFLSEGVIDKQWQLAETHCVDLVYGRVDRYLEVESRVLPAPEPGLWDDFLAVQLGESNASHFLGMLFRRNLFELIPISRPDYALREDRMRMLELGLLNPSFINSSGVAGYWSKHQDQMHDNYRGSQIVVANFQMLAIYSRIISSLISTGQLTPRRARAACNVLWPLAHQIAIFNLQEGLQVYEWILSLDREFSPPNLGLVGFLYRTIGFMVTERLLSLRRHFIAAFFGNKESRRPAIRLPASAPP